jgi:hypothetical protein
MSAVVASLNAATTTARNVLAEMPGGYVEEVRESAPGTRNQTTYK